MLHPLTVVWVLMLLLPTAGSAQTDRWRIDADQRGVVWEVAADARLPHGDNVEMSGRGVSGIIHYAVDTGRRVSVRRELIYPQFRPYIRDADPAWYGVYRNYLRRDYTDAEVLPRVYVGERELTPGPVRRIWFDGMLYVEHEPDARGLTLTRILWPDVREHRFYERLHFSNAAAVDYVVTLEPRRTREVHRGERGRFTTYAGLPDVSRLELPAGGQNTATVVFGATDGGAAPELPGVSALFHAFPNRRKVIDSLQDKLILETPDSVLNTMFALAKVRAAESIFDSKLGLVHSPGGGRYYLGFWANDQAEYINPFFPYLGYGLGNAAALNMWRVYQEAIPADGSNIRYSFEMEGDTPANPLDRGDAAMIAYGLSHYLLALGDRAVAEELWPLLTWCLDYNHRMLTPAGVVASASDEMEGRIATGDANLATSALYYGALETSLSLARALGRPAALQRTWTARRTALAAAVERYFGRTVEGLDTYRYYDGHTTLRHWIALPLVVGLPGREAGTLTALFDRLWTDNGVAVEKNHPDPAISQIFWDRGTLYALRGAFVAGATERAYARLRQFSRQRLLGERVPYVVEAYPEGSMAHLSAENALYCRIFTEGMFGLLPTGLRSFRLQPRLPAGWDHMALRRVAAFGGALFDIEVRRAGAGVVVTVRDESGATVEQLELAAGAVGEVNLGGG